MATYRLHITVPDSHTIILPDSIPAGEADLLLHCPAPACRAENGAYEKRDPLLELVDSIPEEEWSAIPADAAMNHDYYLYGAPTQRP